MGQKRKARPSSESLLSTMCRMLIPEHILSNFEVYGAVESSSCWVIELREKEGLIPAELSELCKDAYVVFDVYTNPIETLSHSFVCKPVY